MLFLLTQHEWSENGLNWNSLAHLSSEILEYGGTVDCCSCPYPPVAGGALLQVSGTQCVRVYNSILSRYIEHLHKHDVRRCVFPFQQSKGVKDCDKHY